MSAAAPATGGRALAAGLFLFTLAAALAQEPSGRGPDLRVLDLEVGFELERPAGDIAVSERGGQVKVDGAQTVAEASLAVGLFYAERGDLEQALEVFGSGLERNADSRALQLNTAVTALRLGRNESAAEIAARGPGRDADAELLHLRGVALARLGRLEEARAALERASRIDPEAPAISASQGLVALRLGDPAGALPALRAATSSSSGSVTLAANLGVALAMSGESAEALRIYEREVASGGALSSLPERDRAAAWRNLGILREGAGRGDEAIAAYEESLAVAPAQVDLQVALARLYEQASRDEEALAAYRRAARLETPSVEVLVRLGALEARAGDHEAAVRWLREALPRLEGRERIGALSALGDAYARAGERAEAEAAYREALAADPASVSARLALGRLLRAQGRLAEATVALQGREEGVPASLPVALELAAVAGETGDREREEVLYREIVSRSDEVAVTVPAQVRLATLLLRRGEVEEADGWVRGALASAELLDPVDASRLETTHALLLATRGEVGAAREALAEAVADGESSASAALARAILGLLEGESAAPPTAPSRLLPDVAGGVLEPAVQGAHGQLRWLSGERDESREHLAAAVRRFDWLGVRTALGALAAEAGRWDEATMHWREAETLCGGPARHDPELEEREGVSWLWVEVGGFSPEREELCEAIEVATRTVRTNRARELATSGVQRLEAGDLEAARERLTEALAGGLPEDLRPAAQTNLGVALARLGRTSEARTALEQARRDPAIRPIATLDLAILLDAAGEVEGARRLYRETLETDAPRRDEVARWLEDLTGPVAGSPSSSAALVAHLPGAPIEAANRLAEAVQALGEALAESAPGLRVDVRLFRRWSDAEAELEREPEAVKILLTDATVLRALPADAAFVPAYRFRRSGAETFRRLLVVPAQSALRALGDLDGRSVTLVDTSGVAETAAFLESSVFGGRLRLDRAPSSVEWVPDDFSATANVLYGKTDAALVADFNPLLRSKLEAGELRAIFTSPPLSLPVLSLRRAAFDTEQLAAFDRRLLVSDGDGPVSRFLTALELEGLRAVTSGSGPYDREALLGQPPSPEKSFETVGLDARAERVKLGAPSVRALTFYLGTPLPVAE